MTQVQSLNKPLYILGSSGYAQEIAVYARLATPERVIFFVDDTASSENSITVNEYSRCLSTNQGESILGSGHCEVRRKMLSQIKPPFATIICPTATVLGIVGPGSVIAPGAVVAPAAVLNLHVLVNYNATVGHDTEIEQLSVVSPGAAVGGRCYLEEAVYIGAGAVIRENLRISRDAVVGMGAVVTKNVPAGVVAVGNPARFRVKTSRRGE